MQTQQNSQSRTICILLQRRKRFNRKNKTIEQTKAKYPELFKGSENTNPFLKNVDGYIAYAPEPEKGKYTPIFETKKRNSKKL